MKIILSSKCEVLVVFNNQNLVINNSFARLDLDDKTFFKVYPLSSRELIPFAFCVYNENDKIICTSKHVKTISFPNYLEIEILPFALSQNAFPNLVNEFSLNRTSGMKCEIKIYDCKQNNLRIKNASGFFSDTLFGTSESAINEINNFVLISYKEQQSYYIYLYDILNNLCVLHCEIEQFELDKLQSKLVIVKKLNDSLTHGEIIEISLQNELKILSKSLTYLEDREITCKEIAFFDCVKAGNFKKMQELMTLELRSVLSIESAQKYFEKFSQIVQSKIDFKFYLLENSANQTATEIEFEFKDNLINNLKILYNCEKKYNN